MRKLMTLLAGAAVVGMGLFAVADEPKDKPGPLPGKYAGEAACKKCHFKQSKTVKATKHVKAHEQLPAKYKDDAQCIACHTTGAGQPGGFESTAKTPNLGGVQCEMCHGPSAEHAEFAKANEAKKEDPEVLKKIKGMANQGHAGQACIRCHLMQRHEKHPDYEGKPAEGK